MRLQRSRKLGADLQAHSRAVNGLAARCVCRPGIFGNPWTIQGAREVGYRGTDRNLAAYCVELFREWVEDEPGSLTRMYGGDEGQRRVASLRSSLPSLRGLNLACWCPLPAPGEPDLCHATVLLRLANVTCEAVSDPSPTPTGLASPEERGR